MSCTTAEPFTVDGGLIAFFLIYTLGELAALLQSAWKECCLTVIFLDFPTSSLNIQVCSERKGKSQQVWKPEKEAGVRALGWKPDSLAAFFITTVLLLGL